MSKIDNKPVSLKVTKAELEWLSSVLGAEVTADIAEGRMSKDTLSLLTGKRGETLAAVLDEVDEVNADLRHRLEEAMSSFNSATAALLATK